MERPLIFGPKSLNSHAVGDDSFLRSVDKG